MCEHVYRFLTYYITTIDTLVRLMKYGQAISTLHQPQPWQQTRSELFQKVILSPKLVRGRGSNYTFAFELTFLPSPLPSLQSPSPARTCSSVTWTTKAWLLRACAGDGIVSDEKTAKNKWRREPTSTFFWWKVTQTDTRYEPLSAPCVCVCVSPIVNCRQQTSQK